MRCNPRTIKAERTHDRPCDFAGWHHCPITLPGRPIDGIDVNAEGILPEAIGIARRVDHNGEDGGPTLGRAEATVLV